MSITHVCVYVFQTFPYRQIKPFLKMLRFLVGFKVVFQMSSLSQLKVLMFRLLVHNSLVELLYTLKYGEAINGPNNHNRIYMVN